MIPVDSDNEVFGGFVILFLTRKTSECLLIEERNIGKPWPYQEGILNTL